ncbi:hypothetical protein [Halarchaeum salinum]|uniref:DnaJ central domain-containing protein n=1 Tax=Halarchaeum salinum TaxID=489912 RepID=A0AAV3S7Q3_9EURY
MVDDVEPVEERPVTESEAARRVAQREIVEDADCELVTDGGRDVRSSGETKQRTACPDCEGSGYELVHAGVIECDTCGGHGAVAETERDDSVEGSR